jgi:hypothetical protein
MALDANEHIPSRLKAEEAAAEAAYLAEIGDTAAPAAAPAGNAAATTDGQTGQPTEGVKPSGETTGTDTTAGVDDADAILSAAATADTTPATADTAHDGDLTARMSQAEARAQQAEQQYRTLLGKYNAEVPRAQHRISELETEVATLKAGGTGTTGTAAATKPKATPAQADDDISQEDVDLFGEDLIKNQRKVARAEYRRLAEEDDAKRRQETYYRDLTALVPDIVAINASDEFKAFCQSVEPNSGLMWQMILGDAEGELNAGRIAHVFDVFKSRGRGTTPAAKVSPAATSAIDAQVMPSTAPSPAPNGQRVYTRAEYNRLMDNVAKGHYGLGSEKARKIEAELDRAWSEERVRY